MRKVIITVLMLMATVLCIAQGALTNNNQVNQHNGNSVVTDVSNTSGGKDTTASTARMAALCGTYTVSDANGNVYSTVLIGDQCWLGENLRVGTMIDGSVNQTNNGIIEKHCYGNNLANCNTYGGLYQWNELMQGGAQGICPAGWHIPSAGDYQWLGYTVGDSSGGKLKTTGTIEGGTGLWYAPNTMATNSSGFSALPGGWRDESGNFSGLGNVALFFTSETWWYCCAFFRELAYNSGYLNNASWTYLGNSLSVRCIKNPATTATVTTSSISGIAATTATGGGNVTIDGGATVTARGVVWSTSHDPTVTSNAGITSNGAGMGVFTSTLTGLAPATTYFVRAYATNSAGTAYGAEVGFSTVPLILTVSGLIINAGIDTCFNAAQTINVSNVTVKTGGSAIFASGGKIVLQPATKVQPGGYMHAYIANSQNYCVQPADILQLTSETASPEVQPAKMQDASALFTIFPNPVTGKFTLEILDFDAMDDIQVEICTMMGKRILQSELTARPKHEFDATGWPKGVYLIRVITGDGMSVTKLVRQ